jgi:hypothetical protein
MVNSRCWQSDALLAGRLRSWLVGQKNFAMRKILIPLSQIGGSKKVKSNEILEEETQSLSLRRTKPP